MINDELVHVRYKFKNESDFITISITKQQYLNLLGLDIIDKCKIIRVPIKPMIQQEMGKK